MKEKIYHAIGLMSGSSLDGLDLAYCQLKWENNKVQDWKILLADTLDFSPMWKARLQALPTQNALTFAKTDMYFGYYMAELVNTFIEQHTIQTIDFIASHGHTIFHDPDRRFSSQIGSGAALAALTKNRVISDFRSHDIALGGEGAPLAPLADHYLYPEYDHYINLGGIANISTCRKGVWTAFDVCYANQVLNHLAAELDLLYDKDGIIARSGNVEKPLFEELKKANFYKRKPPKSMSNEWIRKEVLPIYMQYECSVQDKLCTAVEHIVHELANAMYRLNHTTTNSILLTGGGTHNTYLVERLRHFSKLLDKDLVLPNPSHINYKEAVLIALLGVLRLEEIPNSLGEVTGASRNTVNGAIYHGS
ncbi:MAG: anhydro-N-acetylmuramic acid kinase [Saprospiraceae bacterium]|nr:anhydro-N-acetylmuramic acid kinase [Saprospiraceae bacterium]